ncbi:hypothetical protein E2C01_041374 [Portunus trituberculatus]|uniref:Uncharacterized protein n=1 Tax=Portunus trituberculatus TaxID=210409 RepID=A0A5B7FRK6_PORTR|nr:hypothetical protein [Portunus trituberculatus]
MHLVAGSCELWGVTRHTTSSAPRGKCVFTVKSQLTPRPRSRTKPQVCCLAMTLRYFLELQTLPHWMNKRTGKSLAETSAD